MNTDSALGDQARSILYEALKLPVSDRLALIESIVVSCDKADPALDAEWLKEAESRLAAHRSGDLVAIDAEQVFSALQSHPENSSVRKVEELQDQIRKLSPEEFSELGNWFWDQEWIACNAQVEADVNSGKLDQLIETSRRRYRELIEGEVEGVPGPLVFGRLRAKLALSDEERAKLERALEAYERDGNPGRPAEDVIADIKKKLGIARAD